MEERRKAAPILFARHQAQRSAGLPALTVLVGASGSARRWPLWLALQGIGCARTSASEPDEANRAYLKHLSTECDLTQLAIDFATTALDRRTQALDGSLARQGGRERQSLLDALADTGVTERVLEVCARLLPPTTGTPGGDSLTASQQTRPATLGIAVTELFPAGRLHGILFAPPLGQPEAAWLVQASTAAVDMVSTIPRLAAALATSHAALANALEAMPESRTKAMLREGIVKLDAPISTTTAAPPLPMGAQHAAPTTSAPRVESNANNDDTLLEHPEGALPAVPAEPSDLLGLDPTLDEQDLPAETVAKFREAAAQLSHCTSPAAADGARSATERFLFAMLEAHPETTGLFELNKRMPFRFGPARAEVDFVAESLRLALEVDGPHHFQDQDGFRRDRRKDVLLQKHGYLVARFLAEDVVQRLDEVMLTVIELVRHRKSTTQRRPTA